MTSRVLDANEAALEKGFVHLSTGDLGVSLAMEVNERIVVVFDHGQVLVDGAVLAEQLDDFAERRIGG